VDAGGRRADRPRVRGPRLGHAPQRDRHGRGRPGGGPDRLARRPALGPGPGRGLDRPFWIDLHEAGLLAEAGQLDQAEALLARHGGRAGPGDGSSDAAWPWAVRLQLAGGRADLEALRALLAGFPASLPRKGWSAKPGALALHGLTAALRAGLPPGEARSLLGAVDPGDDGRPSPRRAGRLHLEAAILEAEGDPAAYRKVLDHADLYRAAHLLATATRAPPAACSPSATSRPPSTTPARPPACWSAGPAGAATRPPPSCAASATALPQPTARATSSPASARSPPSWPRASNGEIARRLYISTKTASVHVSNILAKLAMSSRIKVATWALRSGLVPPAAP
jgi:Bacterial regulatory proteins, luxR family